jgi:DNA helicase II / ATP-dependent DNA helicase PcrA
MVFIADLHIHSKYSRATSKNMDLESLDRWAKIKGIKVLGTGDFTHPEWFQNLRNKLEPCEKGLFKLKKSFLEGNEFTRFMLTSEISCIYSKNGRVRKIHILVFAPSFEIVEKINNKLSLIGNLKADGRPILGLDAKELLKIVLSVFPECLVVPAHCMTPWFGIFGSKSGFDSIEECFEDLSNYIFAIETGLSADCPMLWRISALDSITLISNSDAHSPEKLGREANVFDTELDYFSIIEALKSKNSNKFAYTIEFFPQEGKYHYDGHRACAVCLNPAESEKYNNICPVCGKPLTIGVLNRINFLADRKEGVKPKKAIPFKSLVPLKEIIAEAVGTLPNSKKVKAEYENLIKKFESEFKILLDSSYQDLEKATLPKIAEGVIRVRQGKINILPGYDGVFGKVEIFSKTKRKNPDQQNTLF